MGDQTATKCLEILAQKLGTKSRRQSDGATSTLYYEEKATQCLQTSLSRDLARGGDG